MKKIFKYIFAGMAAMSVVACSVVQCYSGSD